jgi:hypothetical protein
VFSYNVMPRMREIAGHYGVGGQAATRKEIAIVLKKAENTLVYFFVSAIQYGLLTPVGKGLVVSQLYEKIEAPVYGEADRKSAKMEAFNNSPLYRKLIENFNNRILPNEEGLANALKTKEYGVNPVTCGKATKVFYENGRAIGVIDSNNRLGFILPKSNSGNGQQTTPIHGDQNKDSNKPPKENDEDLNGHVKIIVPFGKAGAGQSAYVFLPKEYSNKDLKKIGKFLTALEDDEESLN